MGTTQSVLRGPQEPKKSKEKLHQLIRGNHFSYGLYCHKRSQLSHLITELVPAYYLGADPGYLTKIYEKNVDSGNVDLLIEDAPTVLTDEDWFIHLGDRSYERAYLDYYSDKMSDYRDDWRFVVKTFLVEESEGKLFDGLFGASSRPLILLSLAFETDSPLIAIEALTLASTEYSKCPFESSEDSPSVKDVLKLLNEFKDSSEVSLYTSKLRIDDVDATLKALISATTLLSDLDALYDALVPLHAAVEIFQGDIFSNELQVKAVRYLWRQLLILYGKRPKRSERREAPEQWTSLTETIFAQEPNEIIGVLIGVVRSLLFAETYLEDTSGLYSGVASNLTATTINRD